MYYAVYRVDGSLQSTGTVKPLDENLAPQNLSFKEFDYNIQVKGKRWNPNALDFEDVPVPKPKITVDDFKSRFSYPEYAGIIAASKTDYMVAAYLDRMSTKVLVELDSPTLKGGLQYLASVSLIEPHRIDEILA